MRVLVALSGGVDSAVAALLLAREGAADVAAVTARLWPGGDRRSCCSPGAVERARQVAADLGLPHRTVDLSERFDAEVVTPFVEGYLAGLTPNPCVVCNRLRLAALADLAGEGGLLATGHYARLVWRRGEPFVARAADRGKDQSYMLWRVPPATLARLRFPLGGLTKDEVRALAAAAGLAVAGEPESQEVCFAPDGYRAFLRRRGAPSRPGRVVDREGRPRGEHAGHWLFTIGQRRGLGVSAAEPLYVLERRAATNEVVVGPREALLRREVVLGEVVDRGLGEGPLEVQLRYRSPAVAVADLAPLPGGRLRVVLGEPFAGVAPGQSAVFYRDDVVVGGGVVVA